MILLVNRGEGMSFSEEGESSSPNFLRRALVGGERCGVG